MRLNKVDLENREELKRCLTYCTETVIGGAVSYYLSCGDLIEQLPNAVLNDLVLFVRTDEYFEQDDCQNPIYLFDIESGDFDGIRIPEDYRDSLVMYEAIADCMMVKAVKVGGHGSLVESVKTFFKSKSFNEFEKGNITLEELKEKFIR